jgi:hypothetical protein
LYDVCNTVDRGQWLVALIEYLKSGRSKVRYLNCLHDMNMLHKGVEQTMEEQGLRTVEGEDGNQGEQVNNEEDDGEDTGEVDCEERAGVHGEQRGVVENYPTVQLRRRSTQNSASYSMARDGR